MTWNDLSYLPYSRRPHPGLPPMLFFLLLLRISIARIILRFSMAIAPTTPIVIRFFSPAHGDVDHTRSRQAYILNTRYGVVVRRIG